MHSSSWQALFVHGKSIFSARQVTKNAKKKSVLDFDQRQRISSIGCIPLNHCLCAAILLLRDHVQTQRRLQISAAHPPSTQCDANGKPVKPVCIYRLPAGFVYAWKTNFLSKTSGKKMQQKIGLGFESTFASTCDQACTTGPLLCTPIRLLWDHVETERRKNIFRKLTDILGFHMTPTTEQP